MRNLSFSVVTLFLLLSTKSSNEVSVYIIQKEVEGNINILYHMYREDCLETMLFEIVLGLNMFNLLLINITLLSLDNISAIDRELFFRVDAIFTILSVNESCSFLCLSKSCWNVTASISSSSLSSFASLPRSCFLWRWVKSLDL